MRWKLARDPFYSAVAARYGEDAAFEAGFFEDDATEDAPLDDVEWLSTPAPRRLKPSRRSERPAVLLATGAFCPVHDGHLVMLARARTAAEDAGFAVVGGYLSPGHDAYVRLKCGDAAIPAPERLRLCAEAAATTDWLSVDPWEALHRRVSVNFTDVTARLRAYLRRHADPRIEVLYVCGADNARFARAFEFDGGCVVVGRPGAEGEAAKWRQRLVGCARVLWTAGDHPAASRAIRARSFASKRSARVVLRTLDARVGMPGIDERALRGFERDLVEALSARVEVRTTVIAGQAAAEPRGDVITLDAIVSAPHRLALSRLFALGGYQLLGHVARPGSPPLPEQVAAIPAGRYVLSDDDRASGGTIAAARAILPPGVEVIGTHHAIAAEIDEDVLDGRDFVLGADDGGLVVALPEGRVGRAPYLLPYVDPSVRGAVPFGGARAFSIELWERNAALYANVDLRVRDLPAPARATMRGLGEDRRLEEVCRWHAARLAADADAIESSPSERIGGAITR